MEKNKFSFPTEKGKQEKEAWWQWGKKWNTNCPI